MTNPYYTPSGNPGTGAAGASAPMRSEFASLQAAFDKLPNFSGNANEFVVVNGAGTGLITVSGLTFTMNLFTVGLIADANIILHWPGASGTLALLSDIVDNSPTTIAAAVLLAAPPGSINAFAGINLPTGWLYAAGQAVSRTTFAALFTAISTIYGVGDGSTTFNLPDLRGRVPVGVDNPGGLGTAGRVTNFSATPNGTTLGATAGAQFNSCFTVVFGSMSGPTGGSLSVGTNSFAMDGDNADITVQGGSGSNVANAGHQHANVMSSGSTSGSLTAFVSGNSSGTSNNFIIMQPSLLLYYIIKT